MKTERRAQLRAKASHPRIARPLAFCARLHSKSVVLLFRTGAHADSFVTAEPCPHSTCLIPTEQQASHFHVAQCLLFPHWSHDPRIGMRVAAKKQMAEFMGSNRS